MDKHICLLTSFESLNATYHTNKKLYNTISKEFSEFYIVNIDNLQFFSKPKKYKFSDELKNRPKNIIFFNPQNSKEFKDFASDKVLIVINNFGKSFFDLKTHLLVKNKNIIQVQIKNIGLLPMTQTISKTHIVKTLNYLILVKLFKKITTILSIVGVINKLDISFICNKEITNSLKKNILKKFLYEKQLLFTKEFCEVNSKFNDELKKYNKNLSNKYIVHLDYYLNYHEETNLRGEMDQSLLKLHHDSVQNFLLLAQKKLNKEVIICIHPMYPMEYFENFYKDLKVVKYKTADFIKDADLVTFFNSSSIINAILLKKKIIQLSSKLMGKNKQSHFTVYKNKLGLPSIELDKFNEEIFDEVYKKTYNVNKNLLNEFISINHNLSEGEDGVKKIIRIIKKRYF